MLQAAAALGARILQYPNRNESLDGWSQGLAILGKNLFPYKYADYLGGGLSSPHPLCCPAGSLKAAPCPMEEGCERHHQIPLFRCFSYF